MTLKELEAEIRSVVVHGGMPFETLRGWLRTLEDYNQRSHAAVMPNPECLNPIPSNLSDRLLALEAKVAALEVAARPPPVPSPPSPVRDLIDEFGNAAYLLGSAGADQGRGDRFNAAQDALRRAVNRLEEALRTVAEWKLPGVEFWSPGARDHMRAVARAALGEEKKP